MITKDRVIELLDYVPETGVFLRKISRGGQKAGSVAGTKDTYGYMQIMVDGKLYLAHRLAWLVEFGEWPKTEIDHIDFNRSNNAISNLRIATRKSNMHHLKGARSDSLTGVQGVSRKKTGFVARIQNAGRRVFLGQFETIDEAKNAYKEAQAKRNGVFQAT